MRVISQNGAMDFPYEISTIFIYPKIENVIAIQFAGDSEISIIGRYSSKEKTIKAMEMLRKAYIIGMPITIYPSKMVFTNNAIFQFPQDDEIEA